MRRSVHPSFRPLIAIIFWVSNWNVILKTWAVDATLGRELYRFAISRPPWRQYDLTQSSAWSVENISIRWVRIAVLSVRCGKNDDCNCGMIRNRQFSHFQTMLSRPARIEFRILLSSSFLSLPNLQVNAFLLTTIDSPAEALIASQSSSHTHLTSPSMSVLCWGWIQWKLQECQSARNFFCLPAINKPPPPPTR